MTVPRRCVRTMMRRGRRRLAAVGAATAAATGLLTVAASSAAAQALPLTSTSSPAGCPLPTEMADLCSDPKRLLPMWRWTWTNYLWSDWGGFWDFSQIRAAIGGAYDMVARILFMVASLIWYLLSRLLYMVLSADFAGAIADDINGTYKIIAEALITSGVLFTVGTIAFIMSAWSLYRYDTHTAWRRVITSWIMLGLLLSMLWPLQTIEAAGGSIDPDTADIDEAVARGSLEAEQGEQQRITAIRQHAANQRGTPLWLYASILDVSDEVSFALSDLALGFVDPDKTRTHSSYCSVYTQQLEKLYLETVSWRDGGAEPTAKRLTPIFLSRLWERAYMGPWSRAQFGSPQAAYNGSCLWAEANTAAVSAPETMAVWASSCGYTSGLLSDPNTALVRGGWGEHLPLYGCGDNRVAGGASIPGAEAGQPYSAAEQDRAWRTFYPDGDTETLAFLNLVSGCGLVAPRSGGYPHLGIDATDGVRADDNGNPQIPPVFTNAETGEVDDPTVHSSGGLSVRVLWGYIERGRVGMRPDKAGDEGEWFSFDVCAAWLTGNGSVASDVDSRTGDKMGFYGTSGGVVGAAGGVLSAVGSVAGAVVSAMIPGGSALLGGDDDEHEEQAPRDGEPQGLNSNYVKHRGDIGCDDAEVSAENVVENMAPYPNLRSSTSADHAYAAASDICTFGGGRMFDRILNGLIVMLVAFSFAFSLLGMTVGTALAQILLVVVIMGLPVVLVASAIPTAATRGLLKQAAKLGFFAAIAHGVFLLILASMVFLIDILVEGVSQATPPGSYLRLLLIAVVPFIVKKILAGLGKRMNLDFTSMKGGMRVTSGLAATGFGNDRSRLADRAGYFRRSVMHGATYGMMGGASVGPRGMSFAPNAIASATGRTGGGGGGGGGGGNSATGGHSPASDAISTSSRDDRSSVLNATGRVEPPGSRAGRAAPPPPVPPTPPPSTAFPSGEPSTAATSFPSGGPSTAGWEQNTGGLLIPPGRGGAQPGPAVEDRGGDTSSEPAAGGSRLDPGKDYDPNPETRRSPRGNIGQAVRKIGRYALKHPLGTFAALGVLSGVGLPAAAAVYLGGKAVKFALRGPRKLIRRGASKIADSGVIDRTRDAILQSQAATRMRERAAQGAPPIVSIDPVHGPPKPSSAFNEPDDVNAGSADEDNGDRFGGGEDTAGGSMTGQRVEPASHAPAPPPPGAAPQQPQRPAAAPVAAPSAPPGSGIAPQQPQKPAAPPTAPASFPPPPGAAPQQPPPSPLPPSPSDGPSTAGWEQNTTGLVVPPPPPPPARPPPARPSRFDDP